MQEASSLKESMREELEFLHRKRLHQCFDKWLDKWEMMIDKEPTCRS